MDSHYINQHVDDVFSKRFCLNDTFIYEINYDNLYTSDPWKIDELQELKIQLNNVKAKLNNYNLLSWHNHTRLTNKAGEVVRHLKKIKLELLTQAWCKFYEILNVYNLIPEFAVNNGNYQSFHLCEAPGAFITSLNHFIKLNYHQLKWKWLATTLNPYYEGNDLNYMINDDRFIVNTLENWCFGEDFTGNIKDKRNLINLLEKAETIKPIYLVTADGSVDCNSNPGEQEAFVISLQYCETAIALNILEKGGNFVLKIFTIFECETICLLFILRCSFNFIHFIKPICSKEGNSEVYVVCLGYLGKDKILPITKILIDNYDNLTGFKVIFPLKDIPETFLNKIIECAKFFKFRQESVIDTNIALYEGNMDKKQRTILNRIRLSVVKKFKSAYNILPIDSEQYLVQNYNIYNFSLTYSPKDENFTFSEKILSISNDLDSILNHIRNKLLEINEIWRWPEVRWLTGANTEDCSLENILCIHTGKIIDKVTSSTFCMKMLIELRLILENEVIKDLDSLNDLYPEGYQLESTYLLSFKSSKNKWLKYYYESQLLSIQEFLKVVNNFKHNDSLIVKHFPLLTQFNVGIIFIIGKMFEKVGFVDPNQYGYTIIFKKLINFNSIPILKQIENNLLKNTNSTVITLVPIKELYREELFECVTSINHIVLKSSSLALIGSLLNEKKKD